MEYYKYCSLQDLVLDDFFREWVLAPTPELNAKWHQFLSENPERWDVIQDASLIVKAIKVEEPSISDQEIRSLIQHTVNQIQQKKEAGTGGQSGCPEEATGTGAAVCDPVGAATAEQGGNGRPAVRYQPGGYRSKPAI